MNDDLYWYWINNVPGLGRKAIKAFIDYYNTPEGVYMASDNEIEDFMRENQFCHMAMSDYISSKNEESIIYSYEKLNEKGIHFVHCESPEYPRRLANIPDPPYGLYYKGRLPDETKKAIAIIGARNSTHYGKEMAKYFGRELAKCGVTVVSGLARGIDGMAHVGALEAGQYTIGVLGCGIDVVYPRENYRLFMQMEESGGIISESNIGIAPVAGLFPQRNRLISGLSDGILVVEARKKSGTFITVDQGLEQGKEIFALPGRITDKQSAGCNYLIKVGAHLVTDVEDVLDVLGLLCDSSDNEERSVVHIMDNERKNLLAPIEKMVYSVLSVEPKYVDDIINETRLAPQEVCMYLNRMVVHKVIDEPVRNYYSVKL